MYVAAGEQGQGPDQGQGEADPQFPGPGAEAVPEHPRPDPGGCTVHGVREGRKAVGECRPVGHYQGGVNGGYRGGEVHLSCRNPGTLKPKI